MMEWPVQQRIEKELKRHICQKAATNRHPESVVLFRQRLEAKIRRQLLKRHS